MVSMRGPNYIYVTVQWPFSRRMSPLLERPKAAERLLCTHGRFASYLDNQPLTNSDVGFVCVLSHPGAYFVTLHARSAWNV